MRNLLFLLIPLSFVLKSYTTPDSKAQVSVPQVTFNTLSDLRAQAGATQGVQVSLSGLTSSMDQNGGNYMWDAANTTADNGFTVVAVSGVSTGRWIRIGNANSIKGTATFSGVTLQTAYNVTYKINGSTVVLPYVPVSIFTQPRTQAAAERSWITNITNTGFTLNFTTVPLVGTLNIAMDYIVIKQ